MSHMQLLDLVAYISRLLIDKTNLNETSVVIKLIFTPLNQCYIKYISKGNVHTNEEYDPIQRDFLINDNYN